MTDYRTLLLNSVASDPTRTLTLRSKWVADWNRRVKALKSVVMKAVVEQDVFGLKEQEHFLQVQEDLPVPEPRKFAYRYSQQKVEAFMAWLKEMESRSLLEIIQRPGTLRPEGEPWSNLYVRSAYQRGLEYARTNIASRSAEIAAGMGLKVPLPPSFKSTGAAISALLHQPFHADRLALAYTRVFDELKGVTAAMDQQISRELAKGIMEGLNPRDIGERIGDRIEAIGATRGRLIARTEVINVHAQAALNEYYSAEKTTGEVVLVQWKATHDSRVREKHLDRDMGVYTKEEAYALIGEPNCRCALLPYIPAVQGMPAKATAAARKVCKSAIEDLDEREKKLLEKKAEMVEEPKEFLTKQEKVLAKEAMDIWAGIRNADLSFDQLRYGNDPRAVALRKLVDIGEVPEQKYYRGLVLSKEQVSELTKTGEMDLMNLASFSQAENFAAAWMRGAYQISKSFNLGLEQVLVEVENLKNGVNVTKITKDTPDIEVLTSGRLKIVSINKTENVIRVKAKHLSKEEK